MLQDQQDKISTVKEEPSWHVDPIVTGSEILFLNACYTHRTESTVHTVQYGYYLKLFDARAVVRY